MMQVYLAGPITGLTGLAAINWRKYAITTLNRHSIRGLSPMRSKDNLLQETSIADHYDEHVMSTSKAITVRDRFDCMRVDMVLVNLLGAKKVSIGTMMELGWADSKRIPIVIVMEDDNLHQHSMVREVAGWIVNDLDQGLAIVKEILS